MAFLSDIAIIWALAIRIPGGYLIGNILYRIMLLQLWRSVSLFSDIPFHFLIPFLRDLYNQCVDLIQRIFYYLITYLANRQWQIQLLRIYVISGQSQ
jgi:hypothetical protein